MEYSYYVAFRTLYNTALCCITAWDSSVLWKRDCLFLCLHIYQVLFFVVFFFFLTLPMASICFPLVPPSVPDDDNTCLLGMVLLF